MEIQKSRTKITHLYKLESENLQIVSMDKKMVLGCLVKAKKAIKQEEKKKIPCVCIIYIWPCIQPPPNL